MSLHISLDFSVPFEVGDVVYTNYPPNERSVAGAVTIVASCQATISSIKIVFGTGPGGSLTVTEMTDHQTLQVERVIYTLVADANLFSAFTVDCLVADTSGPCMFATTRLKAKRALLINRYIDETHSTTQSGSVETDRNGH